MKFYYASGTCALGIHVILEESGMAYEPKAISFADQEQYGDAFKAINPKSKVPALVRDDGSILTEFPAIAMWLAKTAKGAKLVPGDVDGEIRCLEAMDYIVATIHMQGYGRLFRPGNFSPDESHHDKVKARGREIVEKGFSLLDKQLAGKDYLLGDFSIADAALFYVEFWAKTRLSLPLPANCERHYQTMRTRPAVLAALKAEGFE